MKDILQHGKAVNQIIVLKNHPHLPAESTQLLPLLRRNLLSVQINLSRCDWNQMVNQTKHRGLSGTGGTDDGDKFAFSHLKRNLL